MATETSVRNGAVVAELYRLVGAHEPAEVKSYVNDHFAEDAQLTLPKELPYGGTLRTKRVLASVFGASAASDANVGPANLVVLELVADGGTVIAELGFDWAGGSNAGQPSRAIEKWIFNADGLVQTIDAYYLDPADAR